MARAADDVLPLIQPGYSPSAENDEQGLWTELDDYESQIQRSALRVRNPHLNKYVRDVMCRVAGDYCRDLRVYVIRNPGFNASMTATGIVQVWTGLLLRVSSEDELAAVLGHELAHYTQLHSLERLRRTSTAMTVGSIVDMGLVLLTGVSVGAGQYTAMASLMSFSREQETEADLLGVRFMQQAGYDPGAAANVWRAVLEEEERAVAKSRQPGIFSKTHPSSVSRIDHLNEYVSREELSFKPEIDGRQRHVDMLNKHYAFMMEDQLDTNRFGRTAAMLDRHREIGVDASLVNFFQGEMYRQRAAEGDMERAEQAYRMSTSGAFPLPAAHHQLGYIYMKQGDSDAARENFEKYLELDPESGDRAMIEFYLEDLQ